MSLTMLLGHIVTVVSLWLLFTFYKILHPLIMCACLGMSILCVVGGTFVLLTLGFLVSKTEKFVWKNQCRFYSARGCICGCLTGRYLWYLRWKAQKSVKVECGPFFVIKMHTVIGFFNEVVVNLVNLMLLQ